jgi:hypothetical protein
MIRICKSDKFSSAMTSIFGIVTVLGTFEGDNRVEHNRMGRLNAMSKEGSNKVMNSLNLVVPYYVRPASSGSGGSLLRAIEL